MRIAEIHTFSHDQLLETRRGDLTRFIMCVLQKTRTLHSVVGRARVAMPDYPVCAMLGAHRDWRWQPEGESRPGNDLRVTFKNCDAIRSNFASSLLSCLYLEIIFLRQGVPEVKREELA
jgi:hypothetical protein